MSELAPHLFASFGNIGSGCGYSCCPSLYSAWVACSHHVLSILPSVLPPLVLCYLCLTPWLIPSASVGISCRLFLFGALSILSAWFLQNSLCRLVYGSLTPSQASATASSAVSPIQHSYWPDRPLIYIAVSPSASVCIICYLAAIGCFLSCFPVYRSLHYQLLCSCLCPKLVFQFAFCWCGAFPHRVFCYSVHCWCSCWFWAFPCRFTLFPTWFFAGWLYRLRGWFALSPQGFLQFRCVSFLLSICWALVWIYALLFFAGCCFGFLLSNCFVVFQWCSHQFWGVLGSSAVQYAVAVCFRGALIWIGAPVSVSQPSISDLWDEFFF